MLGDEKKWKNARSVLIKVKNVFLETWKGSQPPLLMQELLQRQALSHAGSHICISLKSDVSLDIIWLLHEGSWSQYSSSSNLAWANVNLQHWCWHCHRYDSCPVKTRVERVSVGIFYAPLPPGLRGPSYPGLPKLSQVSQEPLQPEHTIVAGSFLDAFHFYFSIWIVYLTDSHPSTWVHALNVGHQPSWYHHLRIQSQQNKLSSFAKLTSSNTGTLPPTRPVLPPWELID